MTVLPTLTLWPCPAFAVGGWFAGLATIDRESEFDVPPCGAGLKTVIAEVPAVARSAAGMLALSSDGETKTVGRLDPASCTEEFARKFVPVMVS